MAGTPGKGMFRPVVPAAVAPGLVIMAVAVGLIPRQGMPAVVVALLEVLTVLVVLRPEVWRSGQWAAERRHTTP